jgi:hypothetical protein
VVTPPLVIVSSDRISNNTDFNVSVYPGKAAYDGDLSGAFGDGTILAYRFYDNATLPSGGYATDGGGLISTVTYSGIAGSSEFERGDVWTVTDPGALTGDIPGFSSTADFGGATTTISGGYNVNGTINLSSLINGTAYILVGGYDTPFTVSLTMSGAGQPNVVQSINIDPTTTRNLYVIAVEFDDPANVYTSISYSYTGSASNRSRFMGVVLDGEVVAGEITWSGLTTSAVTTNTADAAALSTSDLDDCILVWDTSDKGDTNTSDWTYSRVLGAQSAGSISSQLTNLTADTAYTWRFYGTNAVDESFSAAQTFATLLTDAQAPAFTNGAVVTDTLDITLGWDDNANTETGYLLTRSADGINYAAVTTLAPDTVFYQDSAPAPGTYYYRLAATNTANGSGTDAALCEATVPVPTPVIYALPSALMGESFNLSVYADKAAYDGGATEAVFGNNDVIDYRLVNNATMGAGGYANGAAGRISVMSAGSFNPNGVDFADVWTATDPGALSGGIPAFSSTADFGGTTQTLSGGNNVSGTVSLSHVIDGTFYVLCGSYNNDFSVTVTMSGPGQPDRVAVAAEPNGVAQRKTYAMGFPFVNSAKDYTSLSYTFTCSASNRSRFMGVILTGTDVSRTLMMFR